jgi:hypothetical protein
VPVGGLERVREGGIRNPLAPPNVVVIPRSSGDGDGNAGADAGALYSDTMGGGGDHGSGRGGNGGGGNSTSVLVLLTSSHFNPPGPNPSLGSRQVLAMRTSHDGGESWGNYTQLAGSVKDKHLSYMSAFADWSVAGVC